MSFLSDVLGYESLPKAVAEKSFYDLSAPLPGQGKTYDFTTLQDKVVLIVNTATLCRWAPQFSGLEELHKAYSDQGVVVLGFPSNEFGKQEPGTDEELAQVCTVNHGVTFPLMKKSKVNGRNMNEVFGWLKAQKGNNTGGFLGTTSIKWNFTKFLVDRQGKLVGRYGMTTTPEALGQEIKKLL